MQKKEHKLINSIEFRYTPSTRGQSSPQMVVVECPRAQGCNQLAVDCLVRLSHRIMVMANILEVEELCLEAVQINIYLALITLVSPLQLDILFLDPA